jgi:hypothetical protein
MLPADSPFAPVSAPGPHPATAALRAYAAGKLSAAEEHAIEEHTLDCERCADIVTGFSMSADATTEQALVEVRQRLSQRVAELKEPAEAVIPAGFGHWQRLAAAAVVAGLGVGWWNWQHPTPMQKQAEVAMHTAPASRPAPSISAPAPVVTPPPALIPVDNVATASVAKRKPPVPAASAPGLAYQSRPVIAAEEKADKEVPLAAISAASQADAAPAAMDVAAAPPRADSSQLSEVVVAASAPSKEVALARMRLAPKAKAKALDRPPADVAAAAPSPIAGRISSRDDTVPAAAFRQLDAASAPPTRAALPPPPTLEPAPAGGYRALRTYLRKQAEEFKPEDGKEVLHGTVRVRFTVSAAGKPELEQAKFLRSLRPDYDEEVLRMIEEGPTWIPGVAGGKRAPLPVQVEVLF